MAKERVAWVIHWTLCEYGGPSVSSASTYHATREEAEAYKVQREGDSSVWPPKDPFYYRGSTPTPTVR
jgi:hypothetical protein